MRVLPEIVRATRSVRRFKQDPVPRQTLEELVDLARLSASGGNKQPLKYILCNEPGENDKIFPHTRWAADLKDWDGPTESERPTAYVLILLDKEVSNGAGCDHGIAAQSIVLGAREFGLGACMVGSLDRKGLVEALALEERYEILLAIALGVPGEEVVLEDIEAGQGTAYYRDANDIHHVPKRKLEEIILR
jgi:nitroreductase